MDSSLKIEPIPLGDPRLAEFVQIPWRLHRGDPHWTPPLNADLMGNRLLGIRGLLTPEHPYHRDAEVMHFIARRDGKSVGTISAAINRRFNEYHGTQIGFFGFFECVEDQAVANALLDTAREWVTQRGMTTLRGPGQYSNATHERQGILVRGFEYPPTVELTHNPPYYAALLESYGFAKVKDYNAYWVDLAGQAPDPRVHKLAEWARKRYRIETRPANLERLKDEIRILVDIYNSAWTKNWGYLPLTDAEAEELAKNLRPVLVPEFLRLAFIEGEPAGVIGGLPDLYVHLRPRWRRLLDSDYTRLLRALLNRPPVRRGRIMFFGIRPQFRHMGIDAVLFDELQKVGLPLGFQGVEASMILEDNEMMSRASLAMGGSVYKTWRIYDLKV